MKKSGAIFLVAAMTASFFVSYDKAGQIFDSIRTVFADEADETEASSSKEEAPKSETKPEAAKPSKPKKKVEEKKEQTESETKHQLNKNYAENKNQIVWQVLEKNPKSEPFKERPGRNSSCLCTLILCQIMSQETQRAELQFLHDNKQVDEKHQHKRYDGCLYKSRAAPY